MNGERRSKWRHYVKIRGIRRVKGTLCIKLNGIGIRREEDKLFYERKKNYFFKNG